MAEVITEYRNENTKDIDIRYVNPKRLEWLNGYNGMDS